MGSRIPRGRLIFVGLERLHSVVDCSRVCHLARGFAASRSSSRGLPQKFRGRPSEVSGQNSLDRLGFGAIDFLPDQGGEVADAALSWRKSSASGSTECVEVALQNNAILV
jgi:hypothetical protein